MLEQTLQQSDATEQNPFDTILEMSGAFCLPRCLHVVANLGVADVLDETPRDITSLTQDVDANSDALGRVLRLLASQGVFSVKGDLVSHSPASRLLRDDHPQSMRAFVQMFGLPLNWNILGELEHAVRTGQAAITNVYPDGFWGYFAEHPEDGRIFNAAMTAKSHGHVAGVMASYDFSGFRSVADIGGGSGHLLQAVLASTPTATGVLFDLPHVIVEHSSSASDRFSLHAGDFFKDDLPVCDAYLLMEIIHDWADAEALAILRAVRKAAPPNATLLLIEGIMYEGDGPDWPRMLDIHMLALLGGKQRTLKEFEALLGQAGFQLQRVVDTQAGISIIEATAN